MARWASTKLNLPVWFEFSFVNADKPAAYLGQIVKRLDWSLVRDATESLPDLRMTVRPHGLLLSGNARFLSKARDFPGCIFAVGIDDLQISPNRFLRVISSRQVRPVGLDDDLVAAIMIQISDQGQLWAAGPSSDAC